MSALLKDSSACRAALAAIEFAIQNSEPKVFLTAWLHGEYDVIRREWPDVPQEIFETRSTPDNVIDIRKALQQRSSYRGQDVRSAFARHLEHEPSDEDVCTDRAFWFACGFHEGFVLHKQGVPRLETVELRDVETVDVFAVHGGSEVLLGTKRPPPQSKVRDIVRGYVAENEELFGQVCRVLRAYIGRLEEAGSTLGPVPQTQNGPAGHSIDESLRRKLGLLATRVCEEHFQGQDPLDPKSDVALAIRAMADLADWMVRQGWNLHVA